MSKLKQLDNNNMRPLNIMYSFNYNTNITKRHQIHPQHIFYKRRKKKETTDCVMNLKHLSKSKF